MGENDIVLPSCKVEIVCTDSDTKKTRSVKAEVLFIDEWSEYQKRAKKRKKGRQGRPEKYVPILIPEHGVVSVRFPKELAGIEVRIFRRKVKEDINEL